MNKRLISLALAALLLAMLVFPIAALGGPVIGGGGSTWHAYVSCKNGKGLKLRAGPGSEYGVILVIPWGAQVHLNDYIDKTWVEVDYGNQHGFVMGSFLSYDKPTPRPGPNPTPKPSSGSTSSLKEMFKNFSFVTYTAEVRPNPLSSFVNMRWAPTKASDPIRDYHQKDVLTVIAQNDTWAQVVDPNTGMTGFMMRSFLENLGAGSGEGGG